MNGYHYSSGSHGGLPFDESKYDSEAIPKELDWGFFGMYTLVESHHYTAAMLESSLSARRSIFFSIYSFHTFFLDAGLRKKDTFTFWIRMMKAQYRKLNSLPILCF